MEIEGKKVNIDHSQHIDHAHHPIHHAKQVNWMKLGIAVGILAVIILGIFWIVGINNGKNIAAGDTAQIAYTIKYDDKVISNTTQLQIGSIAKSFGFLTDKLDSELGNLSLNQEKTITLSAADAFGEYDSSKWIVEDRTSIIGNTSIQEINRTFDISPADFSQVFGENPVLNKAYPSNTMILWNTKVIAVSNDTAKLSIENPKGENLTLDKVRIVEIVDVLADKIKVRLTAIPQIVSTASGNYTIIIDGIYIKATWTPTVGDDIAYGYGTVKVLSYNETSVVLDGNNPLAGKNVTITLKVASVVKKVSTSSSASSSTPTPKIPGAPTAQAFVFAYCPYGLQFEKALLPVYNLLKSKANIEIVYIGAMHGPFEEKESLRQLCIQNIYGEDGLMNYLAQFDINSAIGNCGGADSCLNPLISDIMSQQGIDVDKINTCMQNDAPALYAADEATASSAGVSGSPTFILNGAQVNVNRDSESIKKAICDAFTTQPSECSQTLSSTASSPGFGADSSSSSSGTQCG